MKFKFNSIISIDAIHFLPNLHSSFEYLNVVHSTPGRNWDRKPPINLGVNIFHTISKNKKMRSSQCAINILRRAISKSAKNTISFSIKQIFPIVLREQY